MGITREECEKFIADKSKEIREKYLQYNPNGRYLAICITDTSIFANNAKYDGGDDVDIPIDLFINLNKEEDSENE